MKEGLPLRRLVYALALTMGLFGIGGILVPVATQAASPQTSSCYRPQNNTTVTVSPIDLSGLQAYDRTAGEASALTFGTQEGAWRTSSSDANTCAAHDYVVLDLFGATALYVDPPCAATVWGD